MVGLSDQMTPSDLKIRLTSKLSKKIFSKSISSMLRRNLTSKLQRPRGSSDSRQSSSLSIFWLIRSSSFWQLTLLSWLFLYCLCSFGFVYIWSQVSWQLLELVSYSWAFLLLHLWYQVSLESDSLDTSKLLPFFWFVESLPMTYSCSLMHGTRVSSLLPRSWTTIREEWLTLSEEVLELWQLHPWLPLQLFTQTCSVLSCQSELSEFSQAPLFQWTLFWWLLRCHQPLSTMKTKWNIKNAVAVLTRKLKMVKSWIRKMIPKSWKEKKISFTRLEISLIPNGIPWSPRVNMW